MNILLLGSEGQIGKSVKSIFNKENLEIIQLDIKLGIEHDLRIINENIERNFILADYVLFLAFDVGGARYLEKNQNSLEFINNNLNIMINVFNLTLKYNKKIIFASSVTSFNIDNTYGNLKLIGERMCKAVGGISVRLWNIYGYEKDKEKYHVVMDFIEQCHKIGGIQSMTNGNERRQFLFSQDCAQGFLQILKNYDKFTKKVLHLSSYRWTTIKEIAEIITKLMNAREPIFSKKNDHMQSIEYEADDSMVEIWKPCIDLTQGISLVIKEYRNEN